MYGLFSIGLLLFTHIVYATDQASKLDAPIIAPSFSSYFADKRPVRIDIAVCDASGNGEKAMDFFLVNDTTGVIPTTLRGLMNQSDFIGKMVRTFFAQGSEVLMITESLSTSGSKEKISNFIGLKKSEFS